MGAIIGCRWFFHWHLWTNGHSIPMVFTLLLFVTDTWLEGALRDILCKFAWIRTGFVGFVLFLVLTVA